MTSGDYSGRNTLIEENTMNLKHLTDFGLRALSAASIVLAQGLMFEYGHTVSVARLFYQLLGA
jgi:hypothetical protein